MENFSKYIIGSKIHRGYRFPFGGWLEVRHRKFGKFGIFFCQKSGNAEILLSPTLPKVNGGWCSAAENLTISQVDRQRNTIVMMLRQNEAEKYLIWELFGGANVIITDKSGKIIWMHKKREKLSIGDIYSIREFAENFSTHREQFFDIDEEKFQSCVSQGNTKFFEMWDELLSKEVHRRIKWKILSIERTLRAIRADYKKLGNFSELRKKADIILANLNKIPEGEKSPRLIDPYTGSEIVVEIDEKLSPQKFVQKLYARAKKSERSRSKIVERYRKLLRERKYFLQVQNSQDIEKLAAEFSIDKLRLLGEPISRKSKSSKPIANLTGIKRFVSSDGFVILLGRSAEANNRLTFAIAAKDDIWLHAEGVKGANTVIKLAGKKDVPRRTIEEAASLAAFYSDFKHSSLAPVIYTQRKYVHSIRKKPGRVKLDRSNVVMVKPKEKI